jgi:ribosome-associated toxin RatA of RatAB toxin-antitoxin module
MKTARYFALVCAMFAAAITAQAAPEMNVSVRQAGSLLTVEGWLDTRATRAVAWSVLTDYEHFPEFVPGIRANRVTNSEGRVKTIDQSGSVISGPFRLLYDGTMRIEETPDAGLTILFLTGPFKDVQGEWRIERAGNGSAKGSEKKPPLRLVYEMNLDLRKTPFPPPLAPSIAEQQVRAWVEVFAREMESRMEKKVAK